MKDSIRFSLPLLFFFALASSPSPAQERTVIRHAPADEGGGLVLEEAAPSPERRRALEAWHRRYVRRTAPLRREARDVLRTPARDRDPVPACEELARRLVHLADEGIQDAPHFAVRRHVDAGLGHLGRAVTWCVSGRRTRAHLQWVEAEKAFGAADRLLMRLGL